MMILILLSLLAAANAIPWDAVTPLDTYVHSDDGFYQYEIVTDFRVGNFCTMYIVNMTSQKWMDETYVSRPVWTHWMGVAIPDDTNLTHPDAGFLFISGNDNGDPHSPIDDVHNTVICSAAVDIGAIGGYIEQVPNQPLTFFNDPSLASRREDAVIAWTWRTFLNDPEPDPTVICRMPMTKAVKKAMDCMNDVAMDINPTINITRYMITGPSKRGWTTYSIAATDQRVIGIAPLVFSLLKFNETLMSHYQALGGAWSFAFAPYYEADLTRDLLEPKTQELFLHEDMWHYRDRLTLPILQIVSTGDEFFLLQDSHHWWTDIPDPKWTLMLQNAQHIMYPHYLKIYETLVSFCISLLEQYPIPTVSWTRGETADGGYVRMDTNIVPRRVVAYSATTLANDTRRDFRLSAGNSSIGIDFHPVIWTESELTEVGVGQYEATVDQVEDEWVGVVIQATWDGPKHDYRLVLSTETQVVPDTFPVEKCTDSESCYGSLV